MGGGSWNVEASPLARFAAIGCGSCCGYAWRRDSSAGEDDMRRCRGGCAPVSSHLSAVLKPDSGFELLSAPEGCSPQLPAPSVTRILFTAGGRSRYSARVFRISSGEDPVQTQAARVPYSPTRNCIRDSRLSATRQASKGSGEGRSY